MVAKAVILFALSAFGLLNAVQPRRVWGWFRAVRYENPENVEPSAVNLIARSFAGGVAFFFFLILGLAMMSGRLH